jgi:hypothetical protein
MLTKLFLTAGAISIKLAACGTGFGEELVETIVKLAVIFHFCAQKGAQL